MKRFCYSFLLTVFAFVFASCNFDSQNKVKYKILHMQQNIENDDWTVFEEEEFSALVGSKIKVQQKDYEGFTALPVEQQIVREGLSVPVYYERNLITFSFNLAGGNGSSEITAKYGTPVKNIVQTPVKGSTSFTGWVPSLPETFDTDATFTATWNYPCYKVQYLFENADDEEYSQDENFPQQTFVGIAGQMTAVEAPEVAGFTPLEIEQIFIHELADDEEIPVVTVKYNRERITLFIDLNEGLGATFVTGKFGQTLNLESLPKPERPKYEFVGYEFIDDSFNSETYSFELNNKKVLRAIWKGEGQARYVIRILAQNIEDDEYSEIGKYLAVGDIDSESNVTYDWTYQNNKYYDLKIKSDSVELAAFSDSFKPAVGKTIQNKKISGDETTRVDVYVDRLSYMYEFAYGVPYGQHTEQYKLGSVVYLRVRGKYGQEVYVPEVYKEGYTRTSPAWKGDVIPSIFTGPVLSDRYSDDWTANKYTIKFDKNDSDATGSHADITCTYDTNYRLDYYKNMPVFKPGCFIKEWNTKPDGTGVAIDYTCAWENRISNSKYPQFSNLTSEPNGIVTLYAQWQEIKVAAIKNIASYYDNFGSTSNNFSIELPSASIDYNAYFNPSSSSMSYIDGLDAITKVYVYLNGKFLASKNLYSSDKTLYVSYRELKPSYTYTFTFKIVFPKFDGAENSEDFITSEAVSVTGHIQGAAKPTNVRLVDMDEGTMTFKWTNPDAEEIKSVTLNVDKDYQIENLTPGAEVEWTVTGLQAGNDYSAKVTAVDGFDASAYESSTSYKIPNWTNTAAQKGQIYYSDKTWSWKYDETKTPVGIIFSVTADGKPEKIFALEQGKTVSRTASLSKNLKDVNSTDGSENWSKLLKVDTTATLDKYPAFKFCSVYKAAAMPSLTWYLPSSSELYGISSKGNNSGSAYKAVISILKEKGILAESFTIGGNHWSSTGDNYDGLSRFEYTDGYYTYGAGYRYEYSTEMYVLPVAKVPQ